MRVRYHIALILDEINKEKTNGVTSSHYLFHTHFPCIINGEVMEWKCLGWDESD